MDRSVILPYLLVDGILGFGLFMLWNVDWLVHNTLYRYSLVFSFDWAVPYWIFFRVVVGSVVLAISAISVLGVISYRRAMRDKLLPTGICKGCGSVWKMFSGKAKVVGTRESKIIFVESCPICNKSLVSE